MKKLYRREVPVRDCHGRKRPRNDKEGNFLCHCHETLCRAGTCSRRCRNYRLHTNLFVCTVCRFADGTPSRRALRPSNAPHRRARRLGAPVQELPAAYKPVPLHRLPLRGRLGDACERRLWRRERARRSGRIKATDKWALATQTEPLIQQDMSQPYRGAYLEKMIFSLRNIRVSTRAPSRA